MFRQVDADSDNLVHGTSPSVWGLRTILQHTSHGNRVPLPGSGKSLRIHIGVDADSGLVHTVTTTPANAHDVTQAHALLHGQEEVVFADSGYRGVEKRQEIQDKHAGVDWEIAMMPGKRKALDKTNASQALTDRIEKIKASIRAKVEHPFRVIKCQFGHRKTRYRGLAKNTSQLLVMFALSNLWMVRKRMIQGLAA
jgi:IS5 family transposase